MTQDLTAIEMVAQFKKNKAQIISFANQIIESVIEGEVNPLDIHLQLKSMELAFKEITSNEAYKDAVLSEAAKHDGKSFEYQQAKIECKEVGTKYDFANCADPKYLTLSSDVENADKKLKEREIFLKGIPLEGVPSVDEETGEAITIYPPSKSSTTSIVVTLK